MNSAVNVNGGNGVDTVNVGGNAPVRGDPDNNGNGTVNGISPADRCGVHRHRATW
jgi:hypothetical protein